MDLNLTTAIATFIVALITVFIAWLALRSQARSERLQVTMKQMQDEANKSELERRKRRAELAILRLIQMIHHVCNWTLDYRITLELVGSTGEWAEEVAQLPACDFKDRCEEVFSYLVVPTASYNHTPSTASAFRQLRDKIPELTKGCRESIQHMT